MTSARLNITKIVFLALTTLFISSFAWGNGQSSATAETVEEFTIRYSGWNVEEDWAQGFESFKKLYPKATIEYEYVSGGEYRTKMNVLRMSDDLPDAASFLPDMVYSYAESNSLMELSPYVAQSEFAKNLAFGVWYLVDGNKYGYLWNAAQVGLYYNKSALQNAGISVPSTVDDAWTWDEFVEVAKQLTVDADGKHPGESGFDAENIKRYGVHMPWAGVLQALIISNNADFVDRNGNPTMDSSEFVEVIQKVADLANVHHAMPSFVSLKGFPGPGNTFKNDQVAIAINGTWIQDTEFRRSEYEDFGIGVMPYFKKPTAQKSTSIQAVAANSKYPKQALDLVFQVTSVENNLNIYDWGMLIPMQIDYLTEPDKLKIWTNNPWHPSPEFKSALVDPIFREDYIVLDASIRIKNSNVLMEEFNASLDAVWSGERKAAEVLKEINDRLKASGKDFGLTNP